MLVDSDDAAADTAGVEDAAGTAGRMAVISVCVGAVDARSRGGAAADDDGAPVDMGMAGVDRARAESVCKAKQR